MEGKKLLANIDMAGRGLLVDVDIGGSQDDILKLLNYKWFLSTSFRLEKAHQIIHCFIHYVLRTHVHLRHHDENGNVQS